MPRFRDEWVIDRVLIDYVSGGACACCGLTHSMFLPNGTADWIAAMTDFDTDHVQAATAGLTRHPWPVAVQDQIWADRVRLRHHMKKEISRYREFSQQYSATVLNKWCRDNVNLVQSLLKMPRIEIMQTIEHKYKLHSAFGVLSCAVTEQIACFALTGYPPDGREQSEVDFEEHLVYNEGFTIDLMIDSEQGTVNETALDALVARIESLGRPKLLEKGSSRKDSDSYNSEDDDDDEADSVRAQRTYSSNPEFQSDRRIVRLMIARYFADALQKRFLEDVTTRNP